MRKVYIFSGLGVDKRVLEKIDFGDIEIEFVDWITPIHNESIQAYAKRISSNFDFKKPILIGLSFGGIMAVEISKLIDTKKVILIASAKNKNEIPFIYRTLGKLKLNRIIPTSLIQQPNIILYWLFGIKHKGDKNLLKQILKDTDIHFTKWAINEILHWKSSKSPINCVHIHGSSDRILPIKNIHPDFIIKNGGHFMTVNKAKEVSQIIKSILH